MKRISQRDRDDNTAIPIGTDGTHNMSMARQIALFFASLAASSCRHVRDAEKWRAENC